AWLDGDLDRLSELLAGCAPQGGKADLRGWEWHYLRGLCERPVVSVNAGRSGARRGALSPDGTLLATAGEDPGARAWDAANGKQVASLTGAADLPAEGLAFSPDGKFLAASWSRQVKIWDTRTWQSTANFPEGGARLAWSPDGRRLAAVGGAAPAFHVWDVES